MRTLAIAAAVCGLAAAVWGQGIVPKGIDIVPRLTGAREPMEPVPAPPLPDPVIDDVRVARNFPEQPPVIPHSIDGYQLSLNANRCLECHRRQFTKLVDAPMISITHFLDREGQMLADVAPRRHFCTACHVQQTNTDPLLSNTFRDMLTLMPVDEQ
jgi:cytochrome c-type protein NapB